MKSQILMKKATLLLSAVLVSACFSSCELLDFEHRGPHSKNPGNTIKKINMVMEEFASTEENKDQEGHRALFVSPSSKVNFVFKNYNNPFFVELGKDTWIEIFSSWDYEYYPVYTNPDYYIEKGVAIDRHGFQGYKNGEKDIYGNDLFMYLETGKGWKILNISSTIVNPDDQSDYTASIISSSPSIALEAFKKGFNERDADLFNSAFTNLDASCLRFRNKFRKAYSNELHSAQAFYNSMPENVDGLNIDLIELNIDTHDQLTAVASSEYRIEKDGYLVEKGTLLATLVATPELGWKISSMALSISAQTKAMK